MTLARRFFITATNTDIGKTYTTKLLIKTFSEMGFRVAAFKPIETGVSDLPLDGSALYETALHYNPELEKLNVHDIVPIQYTLPAAPYTASKGKPVDFEQIDAALQKVESHCDIVLIEGAGGLLVPVDLQHTMLDMIKHFHAPTLLVSHDRLGCINDTLLNINLLNQHAIDFVWTINRRTDDSNFDTISKPYFDAVFDECLELEKDIRIIAEKLLKL